jgi:outer membrane protein OmpA-like peptidoglycan-associated protein
MRQPPEIRLNTMWPDLRGRVCTDETIDGEPGVTPDILATLTGRLGKEIAAQGTGHLGESQAGTMGAVNAIVPALLGSMAIRASTTPGATELMDMVWDARIDSDVLGNLDGLFAGGERTKDLALVGSALAPSLLGRNKVNTLASAVSAQTGIKSTSALRVIAMVVPLVLAFLKAFATDNRLDAPGLATLLAGQRDSLERARIDMRTLNALGFGSVAGMLAHLGPGRSDAARDAPVAADPGAVHAAIDATTATTKSELALWWRWLFGVMILWLLWSLLRSAEGPAAPPATPRPSAPAIAGLPANVYFDTRASAIDGHGARAIARAAAEARLTTARIEVTGYTDATANEALARSRALAVRDALVAAGIPEASIVMRPPTLVAGSGNGAEARRVEITKGM